MLPPNPVRLFHITAIANLPGILAAGSLLAKNQTIAAGIQYQNIAYQGAQTNRSQKPAPNPPGGTLHDYVPFYFAPRSPMLYTINRGNVPGCQWRQADIVHLETTVDLVLQTGSPFVFYDRNATLAFSQAFTDLAHLSRVAWDLLTEPPTLDGFCRFWNNIPANARYADRMERRQAEFMVKDRVPLQHLLKVGVISETQAATVRALCLREGVTLPVEVKPDWYF